MATRTHRREAFAFTAAAVVVSLIWSAQASAVPPVNDDRADAYPAYEGTVTGRNVDATTEAGERLTCPVNYGDGETQWDSTVWFRYDPPSPGTVTLTAVGGAEEPGLGNGDGSVDVTLALYSPGGSFLGCDDPSDPELPSILKFFIGGAGNPGAFPVQIGGYDDGVFYEQGLYTLSVNFARAPVVRAKLRYNFTRYRRYTILNRLLVNAESGSNTTVRCRGTCPFRNRRFNRNRVNLRRALGPRFKWRRGTVLHIFTTKNFHFGQYTRLRFRPPKPPRKVDRCVAAGDTNPSRGDVTRCP